MKTTSLEVSKKLKEAEIEVESKYSWVGLRGEFNLMAVTKEGETNLLAAGREVIKAPTLCELLELMPDTITRETKNGYDNYRPNIYKKRGRKADAGKMMYCVSSGYYGYLDEKKENCACREIYAKSDNPADSLSLFLIELYRISKFNEHLMFLTPKNLRHLR